MSSPRLVSVVAAVAGALKAVREVFALRAGGRHAAAGGAALPEALQRPARTAAPCSRSSRPCRCATSSAIRLRAGSDVARHRHGLGAAGDRDAFLRLRRPHDRRRVLPHRPAARDAHVHRREARARPASVERHAGRDARRALQTVAVRIRNGHLSRQLSIIGKPKDMELRRVLDLDDRAIALPPRPRHQRAGGPDPAPAARRLVDVDILEGRRGSVKSRWPRSSRAISASWPSWTSTGSTRLMYRAADVGRPHRVRLQEQR